MTKLTEEQAKAALERIQSGQSTVGTESRVLGFSYNGPLRKAIVAIVGRDKYFEAISKKNKKRISCVVPA